MSTPPKSVSNQSIQQSIWNEAATWVQHKIEPVITAHVNSFKLVSRALQLDALADSAKALYHTAQNIVYCDAKTKICGNKVVAGTDKIEKCYKPSFSDKELAVGLGAVTLVAGLALSGSNNKNYRKMGEELAVAGTIGVIGGLVADRVDIVANSNFGLPSQYSEDRLGIEVGVEVGNYGPMITFSFGAPEPKPLSQREFDEAMQMGLKISSPYGVAAPETLKLPTIPTYNLKVEPSPVNKKSEGTFLKIQPNLEDPTLY